LIDKVENSFGVFSEIFGGRGLPEDFVPRVKLLVYNKLTHSVAISQIPENYPAELMTGCFGMKKQASDRTLNHRTLEQTGRDFPLFLCRFNQKLIARHGFADKIQLADFSSFYIEGGKSELAAFGYSRDRRPDRPQVNFGIATGINYERLHMGLGFRTPAEVYFQDT